MNTIIEMNPDQNFKFVAEPIKLKWMKLRNKKHPEEKELMVISLMDKRSGCKVIHPISEFIISKWSNHKINTMRKPANVVVPFLNFLVTNAREFDLNSLAGLKISHGNQYLNQMVSKNLAYKTVKEAERTLTHFYLFLAKKEVLSNVPLTTFVKRESTYGGSYVESIFNPIYPPIRANEVEHILPYQYIAMFLETAIMEANPIALGIYLQFFGGLRMGEIVNIKRSNIKITPTGSMAVILEPHSLRGDLRATNPGVKRVRKQKIIGIYDWLNHFYNNHVSLYKAIDGSNALFVNKNGKAMTAGSYRQFFEKAKMRFINNLRLGNHDQVILANHLDITKWSTHIGRGTFTNLLAEEASNPNDIAQPRGDKELTSSLAYMSETERMRKKIEEKFQNMHVNFIPLLIQRRKNMTNNTDN
ncbi:hypothetical protein [Paenibacillus sp. LHD-38]|uniref:hypothetical protein n=1 Tax=Paenibacillus sp. LHD-38 TaxID=3072143 RepID=UPI00280ED035|nr:hypothetical protein [Paenibacillus sp. LHD-38]MDQ8735801.1 hypothetical protein [Paenibacillus sp. LHD-38]